MKLLIIDDEPSIVETVENKFRKEGFSTFTADSAEEGMRLYRRVKPDLIILDIMMPEMDGYDVCRKLKIDEKYKGIPVIILTAKFQPNDLEFAREMGADGYLTTPLDMDALLEMINRLCGIKKNTR